MTEQIINEIVTKLIGKIPDENILVVRRALIRTLADYTIEPRNVNLVPYTDTLPPIVLDFIATKRLEGKSDKTLRLYLMYLSDFFAATRMQPQDVTALVAKRYLSDIQDQRHISNRSLDSRRSVLSSFFSWASANNAAIRNPMAAICPIKYERKERQPLTDTELELVREACDGLREQAIVEVLYSTGCRVTELERLNRDDVNLSTREVRLYGKGNKHRTSYLSAKASILLKQYLDQRKDNGEALFVAVRAPYKRIKKSGIEEILRNIGARAGVPRLHPHLLRHTMSTNALQHGMEVTQLQRLLGHNSLDTTMIYARVNMDDISRNHRKYIS